MTIDRERLARAAQTVAEVNSTGLPGFVISGEEDAQWRKYSPLLDAILSDITAQGFAIVPREPTEAMAQAGDQARDALSPVRANTERTYKAMITAANPEQTEQ